jgi:hypothetical protein
MAKANKPIVLLARYSLEIMLIGQVGTISNLGISDLVAIVAGFVSIMVDLAMIMHILL